MTDETLNAAEAKKVARVAKIEGRILTIIALFSAAIRGDAVAVLEGLQPAEIAEVLTEWNSVLVQNDEGVALDADTTLALAQLVKGCLEDRP